jgi:hypothetical protein
MLAQTDRPIEQYFRDPDRPDRTEPLEAGMWKMVYAEKVRRLTRQVEESFALVGTATPFNSRSYQDRWPPDEEMREAEKEYWIQEHIIGALAGLNEGADEPVVPVFDRLRFTKQPERFLHPSDGTVFRPIAFELEVGTTFPNVPRLLSTLMAGEVKLRITGLTMERSERSGPRKPAGGELPEPTPPPVGVPEARRPQERATGAPATSGVPDEVLKMFEERGISFGPPPEVAPGRPPSRTQPEERRTAPEAGEEAEPTVELPANLIDVTIRGYVLDYTGEKQEGE